MGSTRTFTDETTLIAAESYIRSSIKQPTANIVKGYPPAMPPFAHLPEDQIEALVAYIKSLK